MDIEEVLEGLKEICIGVNSSSGEPRFEVNLEKRFEEQKALILKLMEKSFLEKFSNKDLSRVKSRVEYQGVGLRLNMLLLNLNIQNEVVSLREDLLKIIDEEIDSRVFKIKKAMESVEIKELWENIEELDLYRLKVEGGWLVKCIGSDGLGMTFYPDPSHNWLSKSKSLESLKEELRDLQC